MEGAEESKKENERGKEAPELLHMSQEYLSLLEECNQESFDDLERANIIQTGVNSSGTPVIIFIPRIGFHDSKDSERQLRRMLLLFIKKAHSIVSQPYILVYDHMHFSVFTQQPLIYRTYSMLPREYKKNIAKLFVVHPTFFIRVFFQQGVKHFVSQKFYNKLQFVESVAELQPLIKPLGATLPAAYLQRGDSKTPSSKPLYDPRRMPPLQASFDPIVGTTHLIHQCVTFLTSENRLQSKGLFRLAGDETILNLARTRLFGRVDHNQTIVIGMEAYLSNNRRLSDGKPPFSVLVIDDIHTVTSILTQSLRFLPESLITPSVHEKLLEITRRTEKVQEEDWESSVFKLLESMPESHTKTLQHLLRFLAQVTMESAANEMGVENISRVFAPTLFPEKPIDSENPMLAYADVETQKIILSRLISKCIRDESSMVANVEIAPQILHRLNRNNSHDDSSEEDD